MSIIRARAVISSTSRRLLHSSSSSHNNDDKEQEDEDDENDVTIEPRPEQMYTSRNKNAIVPGTIYFVSTPLGNLGDITLRALDVLSGVDLIASEDTRTTGLLLKALGLEKKRQVSHHQHNLQSRVPDLIQRAKGEGLSIAVVTDAGTPGISDPGNELAAACWEADVPLVPVPGVCAAITAVSVSGFLSTEFIFYGFLPSKSGKARKAKIQEVAHQEKSCVMYESPNRVVRTLMEIAEAGEGEGGMKRMVLCARELTKLHEELFRGTLKEAIEHFGGGGGGNDEEDSDEKNGEKKMPRGEFTLVLGPMVKNAPEPEELEEQVKMMLKEACEVDGLSTSEAVKKIAKSVDGISKSDVYRLALEMKGEGDDDGEKKTMKKKAR